MPAAGTPLCIGDNDCCTGQCTLGEGDCDSDSDCKGSLVCGEANCKKGVDIGGGTMQLYKNNNEFSATDDCCTISDDLNEFLTLSNKQG